MQPDLLQQRQQGGVPGRERRQLIRASAGLWLQAEAGQSAIPMRGVILKVDALHVCHQRLLGLPVNRFGEAQYPVVGQQVMNQRRTSDFDQAFIAGIDVEPGNVDRFGCQ